MYFWEKAMQQYNLMLRQHTWSEVRHIGSIKCIKDSQWEIIHKHAEQIHHIALGFSEHLSLQQAKETMLTIEGDHLSKRQQELDRAKMLCAAKHKDAALTDQSYIDSLQPLKGAIKSFQQEVKKLQRPYFPISRDNYKQLQAFDADYFLTRDGLVVTFGAADNGYSLMPLQEAFQTQLLGNNE